MTRATTPNWDRVLDGMLAGRHVETDSDIRGLDTPYATFSRLRATGAVHTKDGASVRNPTEVFGHDVLALGYDEVLAVLRDGDTFASDLYDLLDPVMGRTLLGMDGAEHRTYRSFVQQAFTKQAMDRYHHDLIEPIIDAAIDRLAGRGRADLVAELTFPVPFAIIAAMIGLEGDDLGQFHEWATDLIGIGVDQPRAVRAGESMRAYLAEVIADRRRRPRDDVTSILAHARGPGRRLTNDEILSFLLLLLPAGAETSFRSMSNLLWILLAEPRWMEALRADRSLLAGAVEEGLRWEPPVVSVTRMATCDTELGGVPIAARSTVAASIGMGNRDPRYWDAGECFDLSRPARPFLTFGHGPHLCLGMHLVKTETAITISRVLDRMPNLRADPDSEWPRITGLLFRSPPALPVVFDRAAA